MQHLLRDCFPRGDTRVVHEDGTAMSTICYTSLTEEEEQELGKENPSRLQTLRDTVSEAISSAFRAVLPRRCHEPTGPFALVFDMILSLFVPRGACRSTIEKLPLHIIAASPHHHFSSTTGDPSLSPIVTSDKCAICLGPYQHGDTARRLGCDHIFHTEVSLTIKTI